ncbi:MAG: preprotein translocase subunit SecY [Malacoplasma sp.]|nr:preprotein translocase subunit SecY [Malacoplasma sp.]
MTPEQRGHMFDHYQHNLESARAQFKTNKNNLKAQYSEIKVQVNTDPKSIETSAAHKGHAWKRFKLIFGNKQVILGICFTLFLLILYHMGSVITVPGISIPDNANANSNDFASMLNLLAGGGLTRMSIFAVGVGPYITAQIIIQLLSSDLVPPLSRMAKQGELGRRKLEIITRVATLPFALVQSYAVMALILSMNKEGGEAANQFTIFGKSAIGDLTAGEIVAMMVILTGGTYVAIFLGDMITKRGVGNGVTVIILAGIVANLFANFQTVFYSIGQKVASGVAGYMLTIILLFIVYLIFYLVVLLAVVFVNNCVRKIPIQQTGQGLTSNVKNLPYLPIKLNSAGVIPVIFASSIITIPTTVAQFLSEGSGKWIIQDYFTLSSWSGLSIFFVLIVLFTFFYSYVQINPPQMAENFEKAGKFIPGVKSGDDTAKHISRVLSRVNWIGSFILAIIAVLPYIVGMVTNIPSGIAVGGTGMIIIVGGTIEIWNSIKSAATTTGYEITGKKIAANYYDIDEDKNKKVEELW